MPWGYMAFNLYQEMGLLCQRWFLHRAPKLTGASWHYEFSTFEHEVPAKCNKMLLILKTQPNIQHFNVYSSEIGDDFCEL